MQTHNDRFTAIALPPISGGRGIDARVVAEFREMPGLTLTLPQASRLFALQPAECERIFRSLVRAGELKVIGRSYAYARGSVR
jgi:hypothetical protein